MQCIQQGDLRISSAQRHCNATHQGISGRPISKTRTVYFSTILSATSSVQQSSPTTHAAAAAAAAAEVARAGARRCLRVRRNRLASLKRPCSARRNKQPGAICERKMPSLHASDGNESVHSLRVALQDLRRRDSGGAARQACGDGDSDVKRPTWFFLRLCAPHKRRWPRRRRGAPHARGCTPLRQGWVQWTS